MSGTTLIELPMAYAVRHIPAGRKQAVITVSIERVPVEIATVTGNELPVAGTLRHTRATDVWHDSAEHLASAEYRIIRGTDGVLRLMAPIDSWANPPSSVMPIHAAQWGYPVYGAALPFRPSLESMRGVLDPNMDWLGDLIGRNGDHLMDGAPSGGLLISSGRDRAVSLLHAAVRRSALVDGVPYGAVSAPIVSPRLLGGPEHGHSSRILTGITPEWYSKQFSREPVLVINAPLLPDGSVVPAEAKTREISSFEVSNPEGFVIDRAWRQFISFARAATVATAVSERVKQRMMPEEIMALRATNERLHPAYLPDRRDTSLVSDVMRTLRVLHSAAPGTFRTFQAGLEAAIKDMTRTIEPGTLEARLEQAGIRPGNPGQAR